MSEPARLGGLLARFWAGVAAAFVLGLIAFRGLMFDPRLPYSQVVSIGALLAALLALRRGGAPGAAAVVAAGFAVWQGWTATAAGSPRAFGQVAFFVVLSAGCLAVAFLFHELHERGFRLGKFLLTGPALAGVYFAATPALTLGVGDVDVLRDLLANLFLGIVIGDGVGLGVELTDLAIDAREARRRISAPPA